MVSILQQWNALLIILNQLEMLNGFDYDRSIRNTNKHTRVRHRSFYCTKKNYLKICVMSVF